MINDNNKWECWVVNAIANIPYNVSLSDAIKVEETLKDLYKKITGKSL